jgi:hypothetical protein
MKQLHVYIADKLHNNLWKMARRRNITLTAYVNRALMRYIIDELKYERDDEANKNCICKEKHMLLLKN